MTFLLSFSEEIAFQSMKYAFILDITVFYYINLCTLNTFVEIKLIKGTVPLEIQTPDQ